MFKGFVREGELRRWVPWGGVALLILTAVAIETSMEAVCWDQKASDAAKIGEAAGCFEFWLNRYQTLVGAGVALLAGWLALVGARGQIRVASEQLPLVSQQAAAVRADQIAKILGATIDLGVQISDAFDELFMAAGELRIVFFTMRLNESFGEPLITRHLLPEQAQEASEKFAQYTERAAVIEVKLAKLREASAAAQINPMLRTSLRCHSEMRDFNSRIRNQAYLMKRIYDNADNRANVHAKSIETIDNEFYNLEGFINSSRIELDISYNTLKKQLNKVTRNIIYK